MWQRIEKEFLLLSRYEKSGLPTIERYVIWDEVSDKCKVELLIPVKSK